MGYIKILDEKVSNIIAAGEVVENPASMIKEMIENSLDAKATMIKIEVFKAGTDVKVSDNGIGMDKDDTLLSVERHATSKIKEKEAVFNLNTYGFCGEALSSIAAVSKLTITTRSENSPVGYKIGCYGGVVRKFEEVSRNVGTEMEVRDLFYNTPARRKFLRKMSTEYGKIRDIVLKEALSNSNVAFSLELDGKSTIKTSGKGIDNTILELFGKSVLRNLKKFEYGYLGNVEILRSSKDFMFTFVNNRYVKSATIERAVIDGYYTKLMKGKYPFAIIFYNTDPKEIDVNVHPSKKIIKFSNDKIVYNEIKSAIDDFFYYNDRENWQPNIDLIKKNININENVAVENDDLFSDDILKGDAIIVTDVGQHQMWAAQYFTYQNPDSIVTSGGAGTMGFGLPAAIGAQIGAPDKKVVLIVGDGGFQMTVQELMMIKQYNLPVKVVILNNSYLGMVRQWQELFKDRRYSFVNLEVNPDFIKIADAYGIKNAKLTNKEDLRTKLKDLILSDEGVLIECVVEKEENVFPMIPAGKTVSQMIGKKGELENE